MHEVWKKIKIKHKLGEVHTVKPVLKEPWVIQNYV
jgi:hypothetical protein